VRTLRTIAVALALAATLAVAVQTASAGRLSSSSSTIRNTFRTLIVAAGEVADTCELTLEGSFHTRTIAKSLGALLGYVTRVETANCTSRTTILRTNLPWHLTYEGFSGSLPNITLFFSLVRNAEFLIEFLGFRCLSGGSNILARAVRNTSTGALTSVSVEETIPTRSGGGFGCPGAEERGGRLTGTGTVSVLGATTAVTTTLI
jgi:hypothetical protein